MKIKKIMISFFITLCIPVSTILAYTNKVYIGGENVGIEVKTNGVLVVGLYEVNKGIKHKISKKIIINKSKNLYFFNISENNFIYYSYLIIYFI